MAREVTDNINSDNRSIIDETVVWYLKTGILWHSCIWTWVLETNMDSK